jgi:peptide chain release factor subunit 1
MGMDDAERLALKQQIAALKAASGRGTSFVSLYIMPGKQISDVVGRLREELAGASNIKSRATKTSVETALQQALNTVATYKTLPPNGLAVFAGQGDVTAIEPPEPVDANLYRCEPRFITEMLENMVQSKQVYGLLIIDRGEFTLGLLRGKRTELLVNIESNIMSKHSKGGQSAHRYERQIEEATVNYYKRAGEKTNDALMPMIDRLSGIIIGGPGYGKNEFVGDEYLDYRLRAKIIKPLFDVGYTDEQGLRELVASASKTLDGMEITKERDLIQRFLSGIRTGTSVYGQDQIQQALADGRVATLIVTDDVQMNTAGWDRAGAIEYVGTESDEGEQFFRGFGGIGAILRW